jgi:hypothetical protein
MDEEKRIKTILEASYKPQRQAQEDLGKIGFDYDPELSTMENKVFIDKSGKPSIAFRGSTRVSDFLIEDPALALGIKTPKQKKAEELVKKVESKYGKPVDTYGHSLGGYRAETSGAKGNIYTYNKAVGLGQIGKTLSARQKDIRTSKDIVSIGSLLQFGGNKKTIQSPVFQSEIASHGLSNLKIEPKKKSIFSLPKLFY